MKKYKAIFFDWDGTAVLSRKAPADDAVNAMKPLLAQGIKLIIVSGTTLENIAGGDIARFFTQKELSNLYLGLGRGACNYAFTENGSPDLFQNAVPSMETLLKIHRACFELHEELLSLYGLSTDIVFSRPNYCKLDLMTEHARGDNLFLQENEVTLLKKLLAEHGITGGLHQLLSLAEKQGQKYGISLKPTCDAKYLEAGITTKSDNVDAILDKLYAESEILPLQCAYLGDEFVGIEKGIYGSDSFMITEKSMPGDFYDVSSLKGDRPDNVWLMPGGVAAFLQFLREQAELPAI